MKLLLTKKANSNAKIFIDCSELVIKDSEIVNGCTAYNVFEQKTTQFNLSKMKFDIDTLNKYIFHKIPAILIATPSFVFFILDWVLPIRYANLAVPYMQFYMYSVMVIDSLLFITSLIKHRDFISIFSILLII